MSAPSILTQLTEASHGLQFVSETEADIVPYVWPAVEGEPTPANVAKLGGHTADEPIEVMTLANFFRAVPPEEKPRFAKLAEMLTKVLGTVQVIKVGKVKMAVYIVGKSPDGGWAGLKTEVVET